MRVSIDQVLMEHSKTIHKLLDIKSQIATAGESIIDALKIEESRLILLQ